MRLGIILASTLSLTACGGPSPGGGCSGSGFACADSSSALECAQGAWRLLPCRGPGGCSKVGSGIRCDTSLNVAGDACGSPAEGTGFCADGGRATLECRSGTLVQTNACTTCVVQGAQVTCIN